MLTCKEVVQIVSSADDRSWRRQMGVRFHLFICSYCAKYVRHLELIQSGFQRLFKEKSQTADAATIAKLEADIIKRIPQK